MMIRKMRLRNAGPDCKGGNGEMQYCSGKRLKVSDKLAGSQLSFFKSTALDITVVTRPIIYMKFLPEST